MPCLPYLSGLDRQPASHQIKAFVSCSDMTCMLQQQLLIKYHYTVLYNLEPDSSFFLSLFIFYSSYPPPPPSPPPSPPSPSPPPPSPPPPSPPPFPPPYCSLPPSFFIPFFTNECSQTDSS